MVDDERGGRGLSLGAMLLCSALYWGGRWLWQTMHWWGIALLAAVVLLVLIAVALASDPPPPDLAPEPERRAPHRLRIRAAVHQKQLSDRVQRLQTLAGSAPPAVVAAELAQAEADLAHLDRLRANNSPDGWAALEALVADLDQR